MLFIPHSVKSTDVNDIGIYFPNTRVCEYGVKVDTTQDDLFQIIRRYKTRNGTEYVGTVLSMADAAAIFKASTGKLHDISLSEDVIDDIVFKCVPKIKSTVISLKQKKTGWEVRYSLSGDKINWIEFKGIRCPVGKVIRHLKIDKLG